MHTTCPTSIRTPLRQITKCSSRLNWPESEEATGLKCILFKYHLKMKAELLQATVSFCVFVHSLWIMYRVGACITVLNVYAIFQFPHSSSNLRQSCLLINSIYIHWKLSMCQTKFQVLEYTTLNKHPNSHGLFILSIINYFH